MHRAFVLIELIVVVFIVAMLLGMLLALISRNNHRAKSAACQSNQRQLGIAMLLYLEDHGHYPVEAMPAATASWLAFGGDRRELSKIMRCPRIAGPGAPLYRPNWFGSGGPGYAPNLGLAADTVAGPLSAVRVMSPSQLLAIGDPYIPAFPPRAPQYGAILPIPHGNMMNFLCCDGHVEPMEARRLADADASIRPRWNNDAEAHDDTWR
jgi:prepilin-type processing-associated H-X9-DG protein